MTTAYINRIATAVPPYEVHERFVRFARTLLGENADRSERFQHARLVLSAPAK
jgi:hypothetical protein